MQIPSFLKVFPCKNHPSNQIEKVHVSSNLNISLTCPECPLCHLGQNPEIKIMSLSDFIHHAVAEYEKDSQDTGSETPSCLQMIEPLFSSEKTTGNLTELEKAIEFFQKQPYFTETLRQKIDQEVNSTSPPGSAADQKTYAKHKKIPRPVGYLGLVLFCSVIALVYYCLGSYYLESLSPYIFRLNLEGFSQLLDKLRVLELSDNEITNSCSNLSELQKFELFSTRFFGQVIENEDLDGLDKLEMGNLGEEKAEEIPVLSSEESAELVSILSEIITYNQNETNPPSETINSYSEKLYDIVSTESSYKDVKEAEDEEEGDYYESGCILNYHVYRVQHLSSNTKLVDITDEATRMIRKYGKKLKPHPLYKLSKATVTEQTTKQDEEIRSKLQEAQKGTDTGQKLEIVNILTQLTEKMGIKMFLTNKESLKEFDCLHVLATGSLSDHFIKIAFNHLDEKDFERMAKNKTYASEVYNLTRKTLSDSRMYTIKQESDIKIVAIECDTHLIAIIIPENLTPNDPKQYQPVNGVTITTEPIIKFLSLNPNQFDPKGNMEWGKTFNPEKESRGGLDYYFPRGWKGYGLKVLGKYGSDDDWLTKWDRAGWSVAYHGVSSNPQNKIQSILNSQLLAGAGQAYAQSNDVNPLRPNGAARTVGTGVYFGKKIEVSESGYTETVTLEDGSRYKVILQCRLNPKEIRIPSSWEDAYVVPQGNNNIRPYRILVKRL